MKNKKKYILSFSVFIIGLFITTGIAFGEMKDTCEDNELAGAKHSYSLEAYDEENEQCNSSVAATGKSLLSIPILFLIPCAITLVFIMFFIFKILYKLIREKLE